MSSRSRSSGATWQSAMFGGRARQPAVGDVNAEGKLWTGPEYGWQSPEAAAGAGLLPQRITGGAFDRYGNATVGLDGTPAAAPVAPPAAAPVPAPAYAAPAGGAPAVAEAASQAPVIGAGAADLANAAAQLQALGMPVAGGAGGRQAMTADDAVLLAQDGGLLDSMPAGATTDDAVLRAQGAGLLDAGLPASDAPVMGLDERRRRAFLDAPDSLEGMRRVRLTLADEIASRGGDLQQIGAEGGHMRPMGVRDLEGALASLPDAVDGVMRDKGKQASRNAGSGTLAYQFNGQPMPGVSGDPDANALAAMAATGVDPRGVIPNPMEQMYGATNALALGLGAPKAGATVSLPLLSDEELAERLAMREGPSFVTPPAGFSFYNRQA